ncbi:MAG TPA: hypothetical protein VF278_24385 [Pirellulales bacterium]
MNVALSELVWRRSGGCCEYCRMPQAYDDLPFQIDHIIAVLGVNLPHRIRHRAQLIAEGVFPPDAARLAAD